MNDDNYYSYLRSVLSSSLRINSRIFKKLVQIFNRMFKTGSLQILKNPKQTKRINLKK